MVIVTAFVLFASPTNANTLTGSLVQNETIPAFQTSTANESTTVDLVVAKQDDRAERLQKFLLWKGSPMASSAKALVEIADKYDLDWTLLPAIAGLESQYGLYVPYNSYNPYGWNNGRMGFVSWAAASETVAAGIRTRYEPTGEVTAWNIGSRYAESKTWAVRVARNQAQIAAF
jgi:hypothetical protein